VVAAGVGDDAALAFFVAEGRDFVVGATEFERADRLVVLRFKQELAWIFGAEREGDELGANGYAFEARLGGFDVGKSDHSVRLCLGDRVSLRTVFCHWSAAAARGPSRSCRDRVSSSMPEKCRANRFRVAEAVLGHAGILGLRICLRFAPAGRGSEGSRGLTLPLGQGSSMVA